MKFINIFLVSLVLAHSKSGSAMAIIKEKELVGSAEPILSLARRDVSAKRIQQCESCKNNKLCKKYKMCNSCKIFCGNVTTTTVASVQDGDSNVPTDGETPSLVAATETVTPPVENIVVGSRFKGMEEASQPRYYSLAAVEPGLLMRLLSRIFNIPKNFDRFVILGKKKATTGEEDDHDITIIDLAQAFGDDKKITANIEKSGEVRMDLVEKLDTRMGEMGDDSQANKNKIIEQVLDEGNDNVGNTQEAPESSTRCNLDEAVDDLIDIMPTSYAQRNKPEEHPQVKPPQESQESSEEEIKNPPVIQDSFNLVGKEISENKGNDDGFVDDNEEARPSMVSRVKIPKNKPLLQRVTTIPKVIKPEMNTVGEAETISVPDDARPRPTSDNQVIDLNQEVAASTPENLEKNVLQTVKDSLKPAPMERNVLETVKNSLQEVPMGQNIVDIVDQGMRAQVEPNQEVAASAPENLETNVLETVQNSLKQVPTAQDIIEENPSIGFENFGPVQEPEPEPVFVEDRIKPSQANSDSTIKIYKPPQRNTVGETLTPSTSFTEPNVLTTVTDPPNVVQMAPQFENRGQFSESGEKATYFGALVPAKDGLPIADPRVRKLYYVGQDINLPLKMFQDENGVMKLRVDTDALCNCKNKNCSRPHLDDKNGENNVQVALPELKVRYGDDELMDSFVDSIHTRGEHSEKFKRSPRIDGVMEVEGKEKNYQIDRLDKVEKKLENKIEKLGKNFEKVNEKNEELLNKGTVALYQQIEKSKDVDKMITLASDLLSWMRDLATEHLKS
ncbi:uncharacterized protein LOC123013043 isoform X2 [Tribolium madens]|uniref:uncharacterized protein LOC123013043 isoform X2 n=1 Tax=Tribolium madens TaxID=41895 RepID=UPI001CF748EF|nr:uncharacterized protein LOC123013043 isoform X2 [Tribolium madens]